MVFVPRTPILIGWPAFVWWEDKSSDNPKAWWAKPNPNVMVYFEDQIRDDDLWDWQVWLKQRVSAYAIEHTSAWQVLRTGVGLIAESREQYPFAVDAFMARYTRQPPDHSSVSIADSRAKMRTIDPKWIEPVAKAVVAEPTIARFDPGVVHWLGTSGREMNDVASVLLNRKWGIEKINTLLYAISQSHIDAKHAEALIRSYGTQRKLSGTAVANLLFKANLPSDEAVQLFTNVFLTNSPYDRMQVCLAIARMGKADPELLELLETAKCDPQQSVALAATMAEAILLHDDATLRTAVLGGAAFVNSQPKRDERAWVVSTLYWFTKREVLPQDMRAEVLFAAANGGESDNWVDSTFSMQLLLETVGPNDPKAVAFAAEKIREGGQIGRTAWRQYVKKGSAPAIIIEAGKQLAQNSPAMLQAEAMKEVDAMKVEPN